MLQSVSLKRHSGAVWRLWREASCTAGLTEIVAGRVRAHQLRALFRLNVLTLTAQIFIALFVARAFVGDEPLRVTVWVFAVITGLVGHVIIQPPRLLPDRDRSVTVRSVSLAELSAAWMAILWGSLPFLLHAGATPGQRLVLVIVAIGMLFTGSLAYAAVPRAAMIFATLMSVATAAAVMIVLFVPCFLMIIPFLVYLAVIYGSVMTLGQQAARHIVDQQLIADAAAEQKRLRDEMRRRESRASTLVQSANQVRD